MDTRAFKDATFGHIARTAAALGHHTRVEIIDVLSQGERGVESLAEQVSASVANTSRHLQILAAAGLVERRVEGSSRIYRVSDATVVHAYRTLVALTQDRVAALTAVANEFFAHADPVTPISWADFDRLAASEDVVLLDVRPAQEYAAAHVRGAINIPVADLQSRLGELPDDATIVAYCRGPYCVMSADAVTRLRQAGRTALRIHEAPPLTPT